MNPGVQIPEQISTTGGFLLLEVHELENDILFISLDGRENIELGVIACNLTKGYQLQFG